MDTHLHCIPVPLFWTPEEAWEVLCRDGKLPDYKGKPTWATLRCDGEECAGIGDASFLKLVG